MEELIAAVILEEEINDLLVYWMGDNTMDIFKKRWRILLKFDRKVSDGQWNEIQGIFQRFEGHFPFHLQRNKGRRNSKLQSQWQAPITAEQKLCLTLR